MEDQGKRLLVAVAIAFGLMLAYNLLFPPPAQKPAESQKAGETKPAAQERTASPSAPATAPAVAAAPAQRGPAQFIDLSFDRFRARFSSHGGRLVSWQLLGSRFLDRHADPPVPIDLVPLAGREELSGFLVSFPNSTHELPERSEWVGRKLSQTEVEYSWESPALRVVKRYRITPEDYLLELTVSTTVKAGGEAKQSLAVSLFQYQDPAADTGGGMGREAREWVSSCEADDEVHRHHAVDLGEGAKEQTGSVQWTGFVHSYFVAAVSPRRDADKRLTCVLRSTADLAGAMESRLVFPFLSLRAGDPPYTRTVHAYLGPKYIDKLEAISRRVGYDTGLEEAVDLGFFAVIARPLLWLLKWFHGLVGNWGLAIILLTVLVKLALLPWTTKSTRSMRAMAKLRPEIERLQKKHQDDRQRLQVEMMNLYKAHGVNPLSGCLPILLQMPIWFALYRSLMMAAELFQAPFIPGWIDDLTAPDPYYVLPILLTVTMFLQSKLTPTTVDSAQQKVLTYGMPLIFGGFSFVFPSGLTLYIFVNTCLTALHNWWMQRGDQVGPAVQDKPAAAEVVEPGPAGGKTGSKPQKSNKRGRNPRA